MSGSLTTHVLDTTHGLPAANMLIQLWSLEIAGEGRTLLKTIRTNSDGRTDQPLLVDAEMQIGIYELIFVVGPYFATQTITTSMPPFLDSVPVRLEFQMLKRIIMCRCSFHPGHIVRIEGVEIERR